MSRRLRCHPQHLGALAVYRELDGIAGERVSSIETSLDAVGRVPAGEEVLDASADDDAIAPHLSPSGFVPPAPHELFGRFLDSGDFILMPLRAPLGAQRIVSSSSLLVSSGARGCTPGYTPVHPWGYTAVHPLNPETV